jgi:hypothetical protein
VQRVRDRRGDFVLDFEDVDEVAVESFGPQMASRRRR